MISHQYIATFKYIDEIMKKNFTVICKITVSFFYTNKRPKRTISENNNTVVLLFPYEFENDVSTVIKDAFVIHQFIYVNGKL